MHKNFKSIILMVFWWLCLQGAVSFLHAQNASETKVFRELSYEEKVKIWNSLSEDQKNALRNRAQSMSECKFEELKKNFERVKNFAPQEQRRIENNFRRMRKLRPQEKQKIRERFRRFKNLPPEKKKMFRKKFGHRDFKRPENSERQFGFRQNGRQQGSPKFQAGHRQNRPLQSPNGQDRPWLQNLTPEERRQRFEEIKKLHENMLNRERSGSQPQQQKRWQRIREFRNRFGEEANQPYKPFKKKAVSGNKPPQNSNPQKKPDLMKRIDNPHQPLRNKIKRRMNNSSEKNRLFNGQNRGPKGKKN